MRPSPTQLASNPEALPPESNRSERIRRLLTIGSIPLLGGIISFMMFGLVQSREMNYRDVEFKDRAQERTDAIENTFRETVAELHSIVILYTASESVTREEFRTFVQAILSHRPELESVAWVPRESRDSYPIRFLEPVAGHHLKLGSSYAATPENLAAMRLACQSGQAVSTSVFTTAQTNSLGKKHPDLLVCIPVFRTNVQSVAETERFQWLTGFVVAELDCAKLIEIPLRSLKPSGIDLTLYYDDPVSGSGRVRVYHHPSRTRKSDTSLPQASEDPADLSTRSKFTVAQRRWTIESTPAPVFLARHSAMTAWFVLGGSLFFTALMAAFLWGSGRRNEAAYKVNTRLCHEIGERRAAEARLLVRDQAIAAASNGIVISNARQPDFPIVYANPAFSRTTGYSAEEVLGRNCRFLQIGPDQQPDTSNHEALKTIREALREKRDCDVVLRNFRKDGTPFWNHLIISPVRDATGEVSHFIGVQADITARKEAEAALLKARQELEHRVEERTAELSRAEAKYRGIFDNAPIGIYQSTPEGRYLSVNPALAKMYAYTSAEDLLNKVGDIGADVYVDPGFRADFKRIMSEHGQVQGLEYQVRRRDGGIIWVSEHSRVVTDRKGNILYYEGTVQDVTARRSAESEKERLEIQLRQAQKMEAIGTLAGGIAHDFNNILSAILGFTELAVDDVPPDSLAARNLREAIKGSHRARDLVRQILAFSRQSEPSREPVQLGGVVDEVFKLLGATLPPGIRLVKQFQTSNEVALGDTTQLHQVMMNLCTNAIHAMSQNGGTLTVALNSFVSSPRAKPVAPKLRPGDYLRLSVTDTGHGMAPEVLERIFEPFFTTKPVGQGTGLGLAVVHGILQNHGGDITVSSEPGVGTTFNLFLPRAEAGPVSTIAQDANPGGGKERILVVDDEEAITDLMQQKLSRLGYGVVSHSNSLEALKAFQAAPQQFDLVITDYTMPHLTGTELAQELTRLAIMHATNMAAM